MKTRKENVGFGNADSLFGLRLRKLAVLTAILPICMSLLAISGLAACPPGSIDLSDATNYGAGQPITAPAGNGQEATIQQAGEYCIPTSGITLGNNATGSVIVGGAGVGGWEVDSENVRIFGETCCSQLTVAANAAPGSGFVIDVLGHTSVELADLVIRLEGSNLGGIATAGTTIHNVTFQDTGTANFNAPAIQVTGGFDTQIMGCTFNMEHANSDQPAIDLGDTTPGGSGILIQDNTVNGRADYDTPDFFVRVSQGGAAYHDATIRYNTVNESQTCIGPNPANAGNTFINSTISNNFFAAGTNGIDLGDAAHNNDVTNNTIDYNQAGANFQDGIVDGGGSNNGYVGNTIAGANAANAGSDGIQFESATTRIADNQINADGAGVNAGIGNGANNATIDNNDIQSALLGAGIDLTHRNTSNCTVSNNRLSNTAGGGILAEDGATNHTISNNVLENIGGNDGINTSGNTTVTGNTVNNCTGGHGIVARGNDFITYNVVTSVANFNGIDVQTPGNTTITGNTVRNISGGGHGIQLWSDNNPITNNTIEIVTAGIGIEVQTMSNNTISHNTIRNVNRQAIHLDGGDNNIISHNPIIDRVATAATVGNELAAIHLEGDSDNNVVEWNTITDVGSSTFGLGIDVHGPSDNNFIRDNTISDFLQAMTNMAIGIRVVGGADNVVERNAVLNTGNLQYGIYTSTLEPLTVSGNTIEGMMEAGLRLGSGTVSNPTRVQGNTLNDNAVAISMQRGAANITGVNKVCGGATALLVESQANAGNFVVNGNCICACILARNNGLAILDATGNFWGVTPEEGKNIFGSVDFSDALDSCPGDFDCACGGGGGPDGGPYCCTYPQGWNLISMSAVPDNPNAATIFDALPLYGYDACTGTYATPIVVSSTEGYWLYLTLAEEFCVDGTVPLTDQSIVLACAGWHLIGTCFDAHWLNTLVSHGGVTRSVVDAGDWILLPVFSYDPATHSYSAVSWLVPCLGYWVYTLVDNVTLTIPFAQPPVPASLSLSMSTMQLPQGLTPPPPPSLDGFFDQVEDGLVFTNAPNPVTDVHTTTFMVKGAMSGLVEEVKVQVFDLSGKLIYEDQQSGTTLKWHTENSAGEYLANGVYLYRMSVLVSGRWVASEVKKLAVMR